MATDYTRLVQSLRSCYSFDGRTLVAVGAGGGQIIDLYADARHVVAVDNDAAAMAQARLVTGDLDEGLRERFELVVADFLTVDRHADVVVFEFSLHEMPDPGRALAHARTLAPDILIYDHAPGSPWAWQACEEAKVAASWEAQGRLGVRWRRDFHAEQIFDSRAELEARLAGQGPEAVERAGRFAATGEIRIAMDYLCALL